MVELPRLRQRGTAQQLNSAWQNYLPEEKNAAKGEPMKALVILALALGLQISGRATEDNVRTFLAIDPDALDTKVPHGFGKVFVEAGRQNNIDPSFWPRFPPTNQADGKVAPPG